jgi:hypothetical protein
MFYAFIYSSNKLLPTILKVLLNQSDIDNFIQLFKLSPTEDSGAGVDLFLDMEHFNLSDLSVFRSLNSPSIDNHLKYSRFVQVAIVNSYDSNSNIDYDLYHILDKFEVV